MNKVYLPYDENERGKVIDELLKENGGVRLEKDEKGRFVAFVEERKNENLHPVTGKPILHD